MTPENVATRMPFLKLNSLIAAFFCSSDISRSLDMPARPATAMPGQADDDADQDHLARTCVRSTFVDELAVEDRRHQRAEGGAVAQGHGHAQRHAQVAHGQAEGQAAEAPHRAAEIGPEQMRARAPRASTSKQVVGHAARPAPTGR